LAESAIELEDADRARECVIEGYNDSEGASGTRTGRGSSARR
jgi:hypothetical protein